MQEARLSEKAGAAAAAFSVAGMYIQFKQRGTMQTSSLNPALVWSWSLDRSSGIDARTISIAATEAIGRLNALEAEQRGRERGLVGLVARFFTFAPRVRAAAGLPQRSASGHLVTWSIATVQGTAVATFSTVLAYPVVNVFGWDA